MALIPTRFPIHGLDFRFLFSMVHFDLVIRMLAAYDDNDVAAYAHGEITEPVSVLDTHEFFLPLIDKRLD